MSTSTSHPPGAALPMMPTVQYVPQSLAWNVFTFLLMTTEINGGLFWPVITDFTRKFTLVSTNPGTPMASNASFNWPFVIVAELVVVVANVLGDAKSSVFDASSVYVVARFRPS